MQSFIFFLFTIQESRKKLPWYNIVNLRLTKAIQPIANKMEKENTPSMPTLSGKYFLATMAWICPVISLALMFCSVHFGDPIFDLFIQVSLFIAGVVLGLIVLMYREARQNKKIWIPAIVGLLISGGLLLITAYMGLALVMRWI